MRKINENIHEYALRILNTLDFENLTIQEKVDFLAEELKNSQATSEGFIDEKAKEFMKDFGTKGMTMIDYVKDFIRRLVMRDMP